MCFFKLIRGPLWFMPHHTCEPKELTSNQDFFWNLTYTNILDWQPNALFWKSQTVLYHSTLQYTVQYCIPNRPSIEGHFFDSWSSRGSTNFVLYFAYLVLRIYDCRNLCLLAYYKSRVNKKSEYLCNITKVCKHRWNVWEAIWDWIMVWVYARKSRHTVPV